MFRGVKRPDKQWVGFEYDALGRRTIKTFNGMFTRFVWDSNNPLHEWQYPIADRPQKITEEITGFTKIVGIEPITDITTWVFEAGTFRPTAKLMTTNKRHKNNKNR